ncbi:MAG: anaerobic ribonucleoside-triphosphate reductase, partial [Treponema sp.]|nr:anaerobic ribonucleoside-triphosphate reductase [Treponema sp.]
MMKIIKRNGEEVDFDINKIITAVTKASNEVPLSEQLKNEQIQMIAEKIQKRCEDENHEMNVEAIQDLVEDAIMEESAFAIA